MATQDDDETHGDEDLANYHAMGPFIEPEGVDALQFVVSIVLIASLALNGYLLYWKKPEPPQVVERNVMDGCMDLIAQNMTGGESFNIKAPTTPGLYCIKLQVR